MEKKVFYNLIVILMYLVGTGFSQGELMETEEAEWELLLVEAQRPIVVTVTSSLCGLLCVILEDQVTQVAKTYGDHIIFYKASILKSFAKYYKVLKVPTLIVFKGGIEIKRLEKDFYWGSVYDLISKSNILSSVLAPSDSVPSPNPLFDALQNATSSSSWEETVVQAQLPIVLTLTSSLCGAPCVILKDQMDRLAETYGKRIIYFYTANILEKLFLASLYHLLNVPTVIVFKDGKEIFRFENLSDWGNIYDLIFQSTLFDSTLPPNDSASPSLSPI